MRTIFNIVVIQKATNPSILTLSILEAFHSPFFLVCLIFVAFNKDVDIIPLLVKDKKGVLEIISSKNKAIERVEAGYMLVYLGKVIKD